MERKESIESIFANRFGFSNECHDPYYLLFYCIFGILFKNQKDRKIHARDHAMDKSFLLHDNPMLFMVEKPMISLQKGVYRPSGEVSVYVYSVQSIQYITYISTLTYNIYICTLT